MVANRSHQQQQTESQAFSYLADTSHIPTESAAVSEVTTFTEKSSSRMPFLAKTSKRLAFLLAFAACAANLAGGTLEAQAQAKTAGPAIPKAPATAATAPRPAAVPTPSATTPASAPRPAGAPRPRRAAAQTRPKVKAAPKTQRTVVKKTAGATPKAKTVSTGGGFGQGASGAKVTAVQERLAALNYDVTLADGKYGDQLYHAVMAFQKVNGLSRTGRVNTQTLTALDSATEPSPLIATGGTDRIEIDLQKQYLALYKGGTIYRLLSISSGSGKEFCVYDPTTKKTECDKAITPGGSFRVRSRWVGWRESKLGLLYNPLYFNGGIAIHGAPSVPATPASHGCVRIPMISAQWFPEQVADGTPVYVFGGEEGAPVPLKSKAPADAKSSPTTTPTNTLATIPPAGSSVTLPGTNTLAPVPATVAPTTTVSPTTTTTTGLARLLTPLGTPSSPVTAAPGATVPGATIAGVVITGTSSAGATVAGANPIATQITGAAATTTTRPATAIVTSVSPTPIVTAVGASATTTTSTIKP